MKAILVLLVLAIIAMVGVLRWQSGKIRRLEHAVAQSKRDPSAPRAAAGLELQAKCSEQAKKAFAEMGFAKNDFAEYENHYNSAMNKCFMQVTNTDPKTTPGTIWTFRYVSDAFEGKQYGTYSWHTEKNKKYWEVPPFQCEVTLPSGEKKLCHSDDEFTELVKVYMEGNR